MKENPTTEVNLRRRSTPYDFRVLMTCNERSLGLYNGTSYKYALGAYWQSVRSLLFWGLSGRVLMELATEGRPYGSFATALEGGGVVSLHIPSGQCVEWASKSWLGENNIYEKMIATVPGALGPVRFSK